MNSAKFLPDEMAVISSNLNPGEQPLEAVKFTIPVKNNVVCMTAVLSDRYIHIMRMQKKHRAFQMMAHSIVPLSKVSAVSTAVKGKRVVLTFWWEGKCEVLTSRWVTEMTAFSDRLRALVNTNEINRQVGSVADEIAKFSQLTREGILSDKELSRAKDYLLGKTPDKLDQSIQLLRNLKELQKQGVLSESEFNMKKWDVLSKRDFS